MLLNDQVLGGRQRPGFAEDLRRHPDLADVVQERPELETLQPRRLEVELAPDGDRKIRDRPRVRRRLCVPRLEGVRERLDRGEEILLEPVCLPPHGLEQLRVLDRDRCVAGEHLEQAHVALVELVQAQFRDHDHADRTRAVEQRHRHHRLVDRVGPGNLHRELAPVGVVDEQRLPPCGGRPCDALAEPHDQRLDGLVRVLLVLTS